MAGQSSERDEVVGHIRQRWPRLKEDAVQEAAQQALTRALARGCPRSGPEFVAAAKNELRQMAREAYWAKRRLVFEQLPEGEDGCEPVAGERPRAPRRVGARRPKGVVSYYAPETGFELHQIEEGELPSDELRLAAHILQHGALKEIQSNEAVHPSVGKALQKLFRRLYGYSPLEVWAAVLIEEVARARLARLTPTEEKRTAPDPANTRTTISGYDLGTDGPPVLREIEVRPEVLSRDGDRVVIGFYGDIGKGHGEQLLTTAVGTYGGTPVAYPKADRDRALFALTRATETLTRLPVRCEIPEYARDVDLVCWLEVRMGFQGGGGPHSVNKDRLRELLLAPGKLADAIQTHGPRMAERMNEAEAQKMEAAMTALADRIRSWAARSPN